MDNKRSSATKPATKSATKSSPTSTSSPSKKKSTKRNPRAATLLVYIEDYIAQQKIDDSAPIDDVLAQLKDSIVAESTAKVRN